MRSKFQTKERERSWKKKGGLKSLKLGSVVVVRVCVCDLLRQWRLVRTVLGVLCVHHHSLLRDRDLGSSKQKSLLVSIYRRVQCPVSRSSHFLSFTLSLSLSVLALFSSLSRAPPPLSPHRSINLHSLINNIGFLSNLTYSVHSTDYMRDRIYISYIGTARII